MTFRLLLIAMLIALAAPDAARARQAPPVPAATSTLGGFPTSPVTQE